MTDALLVWADVVLVMDSDQQKQVNDMQMALCNNNEDMMFDYQFKQVVNLDVPDDFEYRNPKLVKIFTDKFDDLLGSND